MLTTPLLSLALTWGAPLLVTILAGLLGKLLLSLDAHVQAKAATETGDIWPVVNKVEHLASTVASSLLSNLTVEAKGQLAAGGLNGSALLADGLKQLGGLVTVDHRADLEDLVGSAGGAVEGYLGHLLAAKLGAALRPTAQ